MELTPEFDSPPAPLAERLRFTFTAPKRLGPRLVIHPLPLVPLALCAILAALSSLILTTNDTGKRLYAQSFAEDWERRQARGVAPPNVAPPVESYMETLVPSVAFSTAIRMVVMLCIVALVLRAVLSDSDHTLFRFYLGLTAHAGLILGIGTFFDAGMKLLREDLSTTFLLGLVAPGVPPDSALGLIIGVFEPFNLWALYVLGLATASAIGWSDKRVFLPLGALYVGYRVLLALFVLVVL